MIIMDHIDYTCDIHLNCVEIKRKIGDVCIE